MIDAEAATEISVRGNVANFWFGNWRNLGGDRRNGGGGWRNGCRLLDLGLLSGLLGVGVCGFLGECLRRHEACHQ
jgi:hypothetical protein